MFSRRSSERKRIDKNNPVDSGRLAHQRFARRMILLIGLSTALAIGVPLLLMLTLRPEQLGSVASFMSMVLALVALFGCLISYIVVLGTMFVVAKIYGQARHITYRIHGLAYRAKIGTQGLSRRVAAPVAALSARFAALETALKHGLGVETSHESQPNQDMNPKP